MELVVNTLKEPSGEFLERVPRAISPFLGASSDRMAEAGSPCCIPFPKKIRSSAKADTTTAPVPISERLLAW